MFGRLEHHGVPRGKGRGEFPCRQQQGRVPRCDRCHNTERFFTGEIEKSRPVARQNTSFDLVCKTREVMEPLWRVVKLRAHFAEKLSVVSAFNFRQSVCVLRQEIGQPSQECSSSARGHPPPILAVERLC